jgi:Zn-dependent peptidase ImmA (M78 family)
VRHIVLYRPQPGNPFLEAKAIAHELGHIVKHWPKDKNISEESSRWRRLNKKVMIFLSNEPTIENEADEFAEILIKHELGRWWKAKKRKISLIQSIKSWLRGRG